MQAWGTPQINSQQTAVDFRALLDALGSPGECEKFALSNDFFYNTNVHPSLTLFSSSFFFLFLFSYLLFHS
jgi:hypothetical protein